MVGNHSFGDNWSFFECDMNKIKIIFHFLKAILANLIYGFPSCDMRLIGVTGTDGKTTTCYMIYHILKKNGFKVGMISTVGIDLGKGIDINEKHSTTPDVFVIQKLFYEARRNGVEYMIVEVSSHGLVQHRLWGCCFEVSVFTNLSAEHLDYHKNLSEYLVAKSKLFTMSRRAIFNLDDKTCSGLMKKFPVHKTYSLLKRTADYNLEKVCLKIPVGGDYNMSNALAAVGVCDRLGVSVFKSSRALTSFKLPPGRLEIIQTSPFMVINDFAHTPNGLDNLFSWLGTKHRRIIHVFGCPGKRDKKKRSMMGEVSACYSKVMILTAEDPRDESVKEINEQIKEGVPKNYIGKIISVSDRRKAIKRAISMAKKGDLVVFTGKGPERTQELGNKIILWNETEIIKEIIKKY